MLEAGSVSGFDAEEAVLIASFEPERAVAAERGWISCSPRAPWGVHDRSLSEGTCRRCGWSRTRM